MIDADWIRTGIEWAAQAEHGTIPRLTLIDFRELLALAARTVEAEADIQALRFNDAAELKMGQIYKRRLGDAESSRDRLALALDAAVTFASAPSPEKYERFCAAIASAKGEQP